MSRLQLAINVTDLDAAIAHYTTLFGVGPAKIKPGYANFAIPNPPLKLVLFENAEAEQGSINHLGVEVETREEVASEHARLAAAGVPLFVEGETTCCYAVQDKFWVEGGPTRYEVYTVLAPAESLFAEGSTCCGEEAHDEAADATVACCGVAETEAVAVPEPVAIGRCC
ncbi:MAG: ArsI/CadI family heavy metal resistance metalloenzyme [Ilumatobacteraceae bacterium]